MAYLSSFVWRTRHMVETSRLSATARSVRRDRLTYLSPWKLRRLETTLKQVLQNNVPGDIAEFGIALGGSAIILSQEATRHGRGFHGFDVFGMIPPPTSAKDGEKAKDRYKTIASRESRGIGGDLYYGYRDNLYDEVCSSFGKYGLAVDGSMVTLHKGLFEDTLPVAEIKKFAFAHIDCDWYDPVRFCLNSLADRISPGGVILIDDYHDYGGCRTATDEFLQVRSDFAFEDGENVILRRTGLNG
ncbi:asparagine synthase [Phyllobacterium salinisoli]|uniref:Asparagine synthase n=2 Tax=Phyllobacterium salinisoli TaxID=1899321 RepID=A0A368K4K6_9HYPH|nr:asparagine synthase [Phyllobacterium salinisoli]